MHRVRPGDLDPGHSDRPAAIDALVREEPDEEDEEEGDDERDDQDDEDDDEGYSE